MYRQNKKYKNKTNSRYKKIIIVLLVLALFTGGILYWYNSRNNTSDPNQANTGSNQDEANNDKIDYSPPTDDEKKAADAVKDPSQPRTTTHSPTQNNSTKKKVKPVITSAESNSVSAYIPGVFEEGGTCTAVFTKNGTTKTISSKGFQNVSYTQCAPINIDSGFLSQGTWNLSLKYTSTNSEGVSASQNLEI